ncbi:MAG: hypothetical protein IJT04_08395, partial [Bacteroidales bacterium]|nr:hypothetical protein [Bacteroidales bacterium]
VREARYLSLGIAYVAYLRHAFFCEWSLHPRLHSTSFRLSKVTEIVCLWHTKIKMLYIVLIIIDL